MTLLTSSYDSEVRVTAVTQVAICITRVGGYSRKTIVSGSKNSEDVAFFFSQLYQQISH